MEVPLRLLLVDRTGGLGLTIGATLGNRTLASTPPHGDTVDDVSLLGFVAQPACLVRPSWPGSTVHLSELAILPAPDAEQIAHHIALLLPVQLRDVLVRPHPGTRRRRLSCRSESSNKSL